jgi:hypothetical protein
LLLLLLLAPPLALELAARRVVPNSSLLLLLLPVPTLDAGRGALLLRGEDPLVRRKHLPHPVAAAAVLVALASAPAAPRLAHRGRWGEGRWGCGTLRV